jgi:SAM-dependent methyltransferase
VPAQAPHERFADLTYEAYQRMAMDPTLSPHERCGFPDSYREGAEEAILADILSKLPALAGTGATVVDIGCGAGPLATALREHCSERDHQLILVDSPEMLSHHTESRTVHKVAGRFPDTPELLRDRAGGCDTVIAYSVLQYSFVDASVFAFLDATLLLLRPGARALIGDLPNASMRQRFLASEAGHEHHRAYSATGEKPYVQRSEPPNGELDDAVLLSLVARARNAGSHAWLVPQSPELPMANRREDLLLAKP